MISTGRLSPIGLDVGARCVKAVQLAHGCTGPRIAAIACIDRQGSNPALSGGEAAALRDVLARQGFRGRRVVLGCPPARLMSAVLELPPRSSGAPLDQIARMELARANECAPDALELSWWELPAGTRANEGTHVLAVGLRHADAADALDGLEGAGFEVSSVDSGVLGLARACPRADVRGETGAVGAEAGPARVTGLVDLGWTATTLAVLLGPTVVYQRLLPEMGLFGLHARLIAGLRIDAEAADYVLRHVGISDDLPEEQRVWELLDDARAIITEHAESIGRELKASLAYAVRRYGAAGTLGAVGAGGGACVPGLLDRVQLAADERLRPLLPRDLAAPPDDPTGALLAGDARLACAAGLAVAPVRVATLAESIT